MAEQPQDTALPSADQIRLAIDLYLAEAYGSQPPQRVAERLPDRQFTPAEYLMSDRVERDGGQTQASQVRSFAIRLGNCRYPNMKLRISRPPRQQEYLFSVDSHDACLCVPTSSPDAAALEELKAHNAVVGNAVVVAWEAAGLSTDRTFLRRKIQEAKAEKKRPMADGG